jgi:hypothetical protein
MGTGKESMSKPGDREREFVGVWGKRGFKGSKRFKRA